MHSGTVTKDREIEISIELLAEDQTAFVQTIVDTGFNGFLTLPVEVLTQSGTLFAGTRRVELGDGNLVELKAYLVRIKWHGKEREVLALQTEATPLLGMSMLWGSRAEIIAQENGAVTIAPNDE